jgi:hypothetical protein
VTRPDPYRIYSDVLAYCATRAHLSDDDIEALAEARADWLRSR